jgi:glycerol-3-phosphate dehydrogenase (NAD(P)+)
MHITVLGAGAFGSALVSSFVGSLHTIHIVALSKQIDILRSRFPNEVEISAEFPHKTDVILVATPAQQIAQVTQQLKVLNSHVPIVFCSKGLFLDNQTPHFMTTYAAQYLSNPLYALAGPNFAIELEIHKKSFANIAGPDAKELCAALTQDHFVLDPWHDPIGLQLTGCLKNVFAIAAGYYAGADKGLNERAALFPQAFAEITQLGKRFWASQFDPASLSTYGGVGDLVLTCTSLESRNFKLGYTLGQGTSFEAYQKSNPGLAEGVYTAAAIKRIKGNLKLPICDLVYHATRIS